MKILCEAKISDLVNRAQPNPRWQRKNNYKPRVIEYTLNPLYVVFKVGKYEVDLAYDKDCVTPDDVRQTLMSGNVHVDCQCKDFHYRFRYFANVNDFGLKPEHRPSKITNPHDSLGPNCKHIDAVFAQGAWKRDIIRDVEAQMPKEQPVEEPETPATEPETTTQSKPKNYGQRLKFGTKKEPVKNIPTNAKPMEEPKEEPEEVPAEEPQNNTQKKLTKTSLMQKIKNAFLKFGKSKEKK